MTHWQQVKSLDTPYLLPHGVAGFMVEGRRRQVDDGWRGLVTTSKEGVSAPVVSHTSSSTVWLAPASRVEIRWLRG